MCSPAIRALKEAKTRITLLTSTSGSAIARLIPEIDDILVLDAPWVKQNSTHQKDRLVSTAKELKKNNFEAAIIFTTYSQSPLPAAFLCYLAKIPLRAAYCRENPYQLINCRVPEQEPEEFIRHEVQRQLDLVQQLGYASRNKNLSISLSKKAKLSLKKKLEPLDLPENWYALHAGSSAPSRRYPPENYAEVIKRLYKNKKVALLTGQKEEAPILDKLTSRLPEGAFRKILNLNVEELAALIEESPFLISNNTGPVHIASALKTPVVVLYALTNLQHGPWNVSNRVLFHNVPCRLCYKSICPQGHHYCLKKVSSEEVVKAVYSIIKTKGKNYVHTGHKLSLP